MFRADNIPFLLWKLYWKVSYLFDCQGRKRSVSVLKCLEAYIGHLKNYIIFNNYMFSIRVFF